MGILDKAKSRVNNLNTNLAEKIGSDAENHIQKEVSNFYNGEIFEKEPSIKTLVEDGDAVKIESLIEKFMDHMQEEYESRLENRIAANLDENQIEKIEMEDIKETLILYILQQEIKDFVKKTDKRVKMGYREHLFNVPGDHYNYVKGKKFTAGSLGKNSKGIKQSRVVQKRWLDNLISEIKEDRNKTKDVLKVLKDLDAPEEELEPAKEIVELLNERLNIMEDISSKFNEEEIEKAREKYLKLLEKAGKEEYKL